MTSRKSKALRDPWIPYLMPSAGAARVLYCFHHAGGAASVFLKWARSLADSIELRLVQMPGREARIVERCHESLPELISEIIENVEFGGDNRPYGLFGHSLGARVAFEVVRSLRRCRAVPMPVHLIVSGGRAPNIPSRDEPTHQLPDREFIDKMTRYEGISQPVLENRELLEMVTPILRADVKILETARFEPEPPLDIPITALGGLHDKETIESDLDGWGNHTNRTFRKAMFDGGHFFPWEPNQEPKILQLFRDLLPEA